MMQLYLNLLKLKLVGGVVNLVIYLEYFITNYLINCNKILIIYILCYTKSNQV